MSVTEKNNLRVFGQYQHIVSVPDLTEIQRKAYDDFLMVKEPAPDRAPSISMVVVQNWFGELKRLVP